MKSDAIVQLKFADSRALVENFSEEIPREKKGFKTTEKIAVVGLGYVGFPLSVELADVYQTVLGFDISRQRVSSLQAGIDQTGEIDRDRITSSLLRLSHQANDLSEATFYIVTVPTPIDGNNRPDLAPMRGACEIIGKYIHGGDVVVFESTVYPGVTETICAPILEDVSGLRAGVDFNIGYSPERINPGDKDRRITDIIKNVSADTPEALDRIADVYESVIAAGVHRCSSIKVAEASKVIENTQRDVNIALMNELAIICDHLDVNTLEVIEAAATKWNFMRYTPGLVGGHCIGVDPYYLSSLSEMLGHNPEVILASRRVNESVSSYVANSTIKKLIAKGGAVRDARVGVFGLSFKEDVPDMRNSKSIDIINELQSYGIDVLIHDPVVDSAEAAAIGFDIAPREAMKNLDAIVLAVGHAEYKTDPTFLDQLAPNGVLIDVKSSYRPDDLGAGRDYWSL